MKTASCEQKASAKFPSMTKPASKDVTESSSESDGSRRRKRKRKRKNKKSKKRKRHYSSSSSSDESVRSNLYQEMPLHSPYHPLNTAHVNAGLCFENTYTYTQPCNFTNMYTPFPVSMPLACQAPIRSHYPERHCAFGEKKSGWWRSVKSWPRKRKKAGYKSMVWFEYIGKHCHTIFGACRARS